MHKFLYRLVSCSFLFHCRILGLKFFDTLSFQKCSIALYLSLLASQFLMHMLTFCLLLCSLVLILVSLICSIFKKNFLALKYVLLALEFCMFYEILWVTLTKALLIVYFSLLRKVINLKMAHNYSRNMSLNKTM